MREAVVKKGWSTYRFDEMATMVNDRVDNPDEAGVDRYVGLEHLDPESLTIRRWGSPSDVTATKLRFRNGDIVFGRRRVYQRKLAVADFDGICSAHAMVLRAKSEVVLPEFLPFFMQSDLFMERAKEISVGSLSPTINWKALAKEEFALPPLDEQHRIVAALQEAQLTIEKLRQASEGISAVRLSIVYDFESRLTEQQMTTMSEVTDGLEAGRSPASPGRPATSAEYGVLKVSAVGDWDYLAAENKVIEEAAFQSHLEVRAGDLLVTRANADPAAVGRTCIVRRTRPGLMLSDKTWRLQLSEHTPHFPEAILAWTKSRAFRRHVQSHLSGTDAKNISQRDFLTGPIPAWTDQFDTFAQRGAQITRDIDTVHRRIHEARDLSMALLRSVIAS